MQKKKRSVSALDEGNCQKMFIEKREIYMNTQQAEALGVDVFRDVCSRRPCVGGKRTDRDIPAASVAPGF